VNGLQGPERPMTVLVRVAEEMGRYMT
jgi:hypothetical protein